MKHIFATWILLTLLYAGVLVSLNPWDLAMGALLSAALLALFHRFLFAEMQPPRPSLVRRFLGLGPLALAVIQDITRGFWQVSLIVLHLRPLGLPGVVAVPVGERTPNGVVITALLTTLSPGSVFLDVDWERGLMHFHYIDASNPPQIREDLDNFYHRYQRHVFP